MKELIPVIIGGSIMIIAALFIYCLPIIVAIFLVSAVIYFIYKQINNN